MKKQLLALAGMALLFAACSQKDDPQPATNAFTGLLKGMYNVTDTSRYEYNDDKTVSTVRYGFIDDTEVGGGIVTMKYVSGKVSEIWESTYNGSLVFGPKQQMVWVTYVGNNIQKIRMRENADYSIVDSIRYNNGKMEKIFHIGNHNTQAVIVNTDSLVWTGSNITKVIRESIDGNGGAAYTDVYTFDDKPNVYTDIMPSMLDGTFIAEPFNANNAVKVVRSEAGKPDRTNTFQYQYNNKNKVTQRTATYQFDEGPGTQVTVFDYYQ
ncbi:hypothetical protein HHL17_32970 [Chitinophaga sp. G-6-1-13]|uniref:DUF4595 domain-containing protein n=1 Tax=Chitinophaga fulva TaxID=2728842 RepID=A0A848GTU2_9BACT|nr:hypothetical protein [Chitinophaga fulva]NML42045.1 hypothetical protein [Chitinophaga fulva]